MIEYCIKQRSWEKMYAFLKIIPGVHSKDEAKIRRFCEAIWYMANSGIRWRLLPKSYGHFRAVHKRFMSWANKNIWAKLMNSVQDFPDLEAVMIDSTIVRAHVSAVGYKKNSGEQESLGRSRGGFTTKIHTKVDALGNPLTFILTPGQRNDITQAPRLLGETTDAIVIADKGYDSDAFVHFIEERRCIPVIPPRKRRIHPRTYDTPLQRSISHRMFFWKN